MGVGKSEYGDNFREDCLMSGAGEGPRKITTVEEAKKRFLEQAVPCPLCKTPPERLSWVYLVIPAWASKDAEQNKGWVTICDRCKLQVDFFAEK
jgi:hypothetical protein